MSAQRRRVRVGVPVPAGVRRPVSDARVACYLFPEVEGLKADIIIPEHVLIHSTSSFLFFYFSINTEVPHAGHCVATSRLQQ